MAAPNLNAFAAAMLRQVQKAEDAFYQILTSRFLGFATGVQLDAIGRLVGEPRYGRLDDAYKAGIRLRIYINGASGTPEDLIYVARAITGIQTVQYIDVSPGVCRLVIQTWTPDDGTLLAFLQKLCPGGVRLLGISSSEDLVPRVFGDLFGDYFYHV